MGSHWTMRVVAAIIAFALTYLSSIAIGQQPTGQSMGWAWALVGATGLEQSPAPDPAPSPSGKCENCNGTGRVGDGVVSAVCQECGGDGIVGQPPTPTPSRPLGKVTVTTIPGCPPCERLKKETLPALKQQGYDIGPVREVSAEGFLGAAPRIEIEYRGRKITYTGFMSADTFHDLIGR